MIYLAHSKKDNIPAQEYSAHILGVSLLASKYAQAASSFSVCDKTQLLQAVEKAAAYHDLGKLHKLNQDVLAGKIIKKHLPINHVDAGAAYFLNENHLSYLSASIVQAHHIGFPDFSAEKNKGEALFRDISIASDVDKELPELEGIHNNLVDTSFEFGDEKINGDCSVFFRLLLSCVIDADHTDTAINYRKYQVDTQMVKLRAEERLAQLDIEIEAMKKKVPMMIEIFCEMRCTWSVEMRTLMVILVLVTAL